MRATGSSDFCGLPGGTRLSAMSAGNSCAAAKPSYCHHSILRPGEGHEAHEGNGAHPRFTWRDLFNHGELLWRFNGP
jgi:hypothetical protein